MATKKILITGASGYLGQHLIDYLVKQPKYGRQQLEILGLYQSFKPEYDYKLNENSLVKSFEMKQCDLKSQESIQQVVNDFEQPQVLIHLAAMSALNECEANPYEAFTTNCPTYLFDTIPETTTCILLSTDQVYDGFKKNDYYYKEDDATKPLNVYGQSKLRMENYFLNLSTREETNPVIILRSSNILGMPTPYTCRKQSFLQFCEQRLKSSTPSDFFSNEFRSTVFVIDVVNYIEWFIFHASPPECINKNDSNNTSRIRGVHVYNMGGPERASRVDVAKAVAHHYGLEPKIIQKLVRPSERVNVPGTAASPADITMDSSKLKALTNIAPTPLSSIVKISLSDM